MEREYRPEQFTDAYEALTALRMHEPRNMVITCGNGVTEVTRDGVQMFARRLRKGIPGILTEYHSWEVPDEVKPDVFRFELQDGFMHNFLRVDPAHQYMVEFNVRSPFIGRENSDNER